MHQKDIERQYDEDLSIDTEALDVEWALQPQLFQKYSRMKALAAKTAKRMHERVKTTRSELVLKAGRGGADLIGVNPTGPNVDAWVRAHPEYRKAKERQIQAEFILDLLDGGVFAFHQRKAALENLVLLMNQEYFAKPKEPRNLPEEIRFSEKAQQALHKAVVEKSKKAAAKRRTVTRA